MASQKLWSIRVNSARYQKLVGGPAVGDNSDHLWPYVGRKLDNHAPYAFYFWPRASLKISHRFYFL